MLKIKGIRFLLIFILLLSLQLACFGQQAANLRDEQGLRQGAWAGHFENGRLRYEGQFVDDQAVGLFKYYYPTGALRAELLYTPGQDTVDVTYYHNNRQVFARGFFLDQKRVGHWRFFNEMGVQVAETHYHNNLEQGESKTLFPGGKLAEVVTWNQGIKNGPWIQYFEDGSVRLQATYLDDKLTGDFEVFYPNGQKVLQAHYIENLPHLTWKYFSREGELEKEVVYEKGKMIRETIYIERQQEEAIPVQPSSDPSRDVFNSRFGQ